MKVKPRETITSTLTPSTDNSLPLDYVEKVFSIPQVELLDLSPDGRLAIVLSNETGSFQLASLPVAGGSLRPLSHGTERVLGARVSHGSRHVAFSRDFGGREEHQLFRVSLRDGEEKQLTKFPSMRVFDFDWSHSDDRIAVSGATQDSNGIWLVDSSTGGFRGIYDSGQMILGPDWSADDSELCCFSPPARELIFVDPDGKGQSESYTPKAGSQNWGPVWHPEEMSVLFRTDARGRFELAVYERDTGLLSYLQGGELELGPSFPLWGWTPDGDGVYYLAAKEGRTRLYLEPLDGSEPPKRIAVPEGYHAGSLGSALKMTSRGTSAIFSLSSLSSPPAVLRYDLTDGTSTVLYEQPTKLPLGIAEHVVYSSFDGRSIHGWFLSAPARDGEAPCVLWLHGGPALEVADLWNPAIQALVLGGYSVFAPNIRGSTGYGAEFQNLIIGDLGGGDLRDVGEAVRYLRTRADVSPTKIAIAGASYGGYLTFLAMTKLPDLWAAGVAIAGITDWNETYDLSDAASKSFIKRYFGTPEDNQDLYHDRSPIHFAENLRAPLLIWHRGNDSITPLKPIEKFANRLRELGKACVMEVVWDEGHGFLQKTESLVRQYQSIVGFLANEIPVVENAQSSPRL